MSALESRVIPALCIIMFGPKYESNNRHAEATEKVEDTTRIQLFLKTDWLGMILTNKHVDVLAWNVHLFCLYSCLQCEHSPNVWHAHYGRRQSGDQEINFWPEEMSLPMRAAAIFTSMWTLWVCREIEPIKPHILLLVRPHARCMGRGAPKRYGVALKKFIVELLSKDRA